MADDKVTALARRPGARPKMVSTTSKVNVSLPFSVIKVEEPTTMRVGDWISLAGLVVSVIGFSVTIRQLIRIAKASEAERRASQVHQSSGPPALQNDSRVNVTPPQSI